MASFCRFCWSLFSFYSLFLLVAIPVVEAIGFQAEQKLPRWLHWLWYPAEVILYLVSIFLSGALSNIISTTLNSFRLAKLSLLVGASQPPSGSLQNGEIRNENTSLISSAKREASRLSYVLPAFFGEHLISDSGRQLYSDPIVSGYQRAKYRYSVLRCSSENANQTFANTLTLIKDNKLTSLAFGSCASLGMAIPFLNTIIAPSATIGATLLWQIYNKFRNTFMLVLQKSSMIVLSLAFMCPIWASETSRYWAHKVGVQTNIAYGPNTQQSMDIFIQGSRLGEVEPGFEVDPEPSPL